MAEPYDVDVPPRRAVGELLRHDEGATSLHKALLPTAVVAESHPE